MFKSTAIRNSHVIILHGQSNANGLANSNGVYPAAPDTNIYLPKKGQYIFNPVTMLWERLQQNKNNDGTPVTPVLGYTGVEMKLMQLLSDYYGSDQYLIKYAQGGTSVSLTSGTLYNWNPDSTDTIMFKGAVSNCLAAINKLPSLGLKPTLEIWIQGEADTGTTDANNYKTNLTYYQTEFRNRCGLPNLKYIQTGLSNNQTAYLTNQAIVNSAKMAMSINGNHYVSTDGAEVGIDGVHFTVAGYEDIAQRIFNVAITML
ncbi:sialate O-acetylesterase [Mucilaginibacter sp.]|uniref:sialate O-acetylesterase n=1 Tax=Mucilaginibacter sp. TaxID=1882438 RepID=UPI0025CF672B|nr:sialate O-acetylesterase [Mucilaginibacter sp.]